MESDKYLKVPTSELRKLIEGHKNIGSLTALCIDLCGGAQNAGLMLNHLLYWWQKSSHPEGWVYKDWRDWQKDLRLSQKQVATASAALEMAGVEVTLRKGRLDCPRKHYRLNAARFIKALAALLDKSVEEIKKICEPFAKSIVTEGQFGNRQKGIIEIAQTAHSYPTVFTTDSSSLYEQEKTSSPEDARARKPDGDDLPISDTERILVATEGADATPTFEAIRHEADAPQNPLPVAQGFPRAVQRLVDEHDLDPAAAARHVEQYGADECERAAEAALKATRASNPAGLWIVSMAARRYKEAKQHYGAYRMEGKIDDFLINNS